MFSIYVIEKHISELKNTIFDLIEELHMVHEELDCEKTINNFIEIELSNIERRHMFEIATVLNISETSNVLKFLHSINATNLKNIINRYIRRLALQENRRNIYNMLINFFKDQMYIELEYNELQRRDHLSSDYPNWADEEEFDDFMCKFWHETDAPETQLKKAISQVAIKHIQNAVAFGHLIIEKVQAFDVDQESGKLAQSIEEIKNKLATLHQEQHKELTELDNLFKIYVVNDGTVTKALEYVFELNKYCAFHVRTNDHPNFTSRARMIVRNMTDKLRKTKTYEIFFKANAVWPADRGMCYFNSMNMILTNRSMQN